MKGGKAKANAVPAWRAIQLRAASCAVDTNCFISCYALQPSILQSIHAPASTHRGVPEQVAAPDVVRRHHAVRRRQQHAGVDERCAAKLAAKGHAQAGHPRVAAPGITGNEHMQASQNQSSIATNQDYVWPYLSITPVRISGVLPRRRRANTASPQDGGPAPWQAHRRGEVLPPTIELSTPPSSRLLQRRQTDCPFLRN